jgi:hypothetical protein
MAIWGGLVKRQDGQQILQVYVDAEDVKLLLEGADRRHYNSYSGDDMELDVPVDGPPVARRFGYASSPKTIRTGHEVPIWGSHFRTV